MDGQSKESNKESRYKYRFSLIGEKEVRIKNFFEMAPTKNKEALQRMESFFNSLSWTRSQRKRDCYAIVKIIDQEIYIVHVPKKGSWSYNEAIKNYLKYKKSDKEIKILKGSRIKYYRHGKRNKNNK